MTPVTVTDILARASSREEVRPGDAKSAARFERITVDGEQYFVKRASRATDWLMRVGGDHAHRPYLVWRPGPLGGVPASIDHAVVAMEIEGDGDDAELTVLMRDVAAW